MGIEVVQENHHGFVDLLSKPSLDTIGSSSLNISKNAAGGYIIEINDRRFMDLEHQVLSYAGQTILEVFRDDDAISIKVHVSAPVHFFLGKIKLKNLTMVSSGPIHFETPLYVTKALNIKSKELCFQGSLKCRSSVFEIEEALILKDASTTINLMAKAAKVEQHQRLKGTVAFIDCTAYLQKAKALLNFKELVLKAKTFESDGPVTITRSATLSGEELLVKEPWAITSFHNIHFNNAHFSEHGSLNIKFDSEHLGQILIDNQLNIESKVPFHLVQGFCKVGTIFSKGNFVLEKSSLEVKNLNQLGAMSTQHSLLIIENNFYQCNDANTHMNQSVMTSGYVVLESGVFVTKQDCVLHILDDFSSDSLAMVSLANTKILAEGEILLCGQFSCEYAQIQTPQFKSFHSFNAQISILNAQYAYIREQSNIEYTTLNVRNLEIHGKSNLIKSDFVTESVVFKISKSDVDSINIDAEKIAIEAASQEKVLFKNCELVADRFWFENRLHFRHSQLVGVGSDQSRHAFLGEVLLDGSFFCTRSKLIHTAPFRMIHGGDLIVGELTSRATFSGHNVIMEIKNFRSSAEFSTHYANVSIHEELISSGQILVHDQSCIKTQKALLESNARLKLMKNTQLFAAERFLSEFGSILEASEAAIVTHEMVTKGKVELQKAYVQAETMDVYRQLEAKDGSLIKVNGLMRAAPNSDVSLQQSAIQSKDFMGFGRTTLVEGSIQAEENLDLDEYSKTELIGNSSLSANDIFSLGVIKTHKTIGSTKPVIPIIIAKNDISFPKESVIIGENLALQANCISNEGQIKLDNILMAKGKWFANTGYIQAKQANFGFDSLFANMGSLSSDSMTINSNMLNFGSIFARKNLSTSGIFNLNFGLVSANNYYNNSLLSFNAGLIAPNLAADFSDLVSLKNFVSVVTNNLSMIAPAYSQGFSVIPTLISLAYSATSLYEDVKEISWDKCHSMHLHDWYAVAGKVKNYVSVAKSVYTNASGLMSETRNWSTSCHTMWHDPKTFFKQMNESMSQANWGGMVLPTASLLFGTYSDNSMVHINTGISVMPNTMQSNFVDINFGIERSLLSHTKSSSYFLNKGYSGGTQSTFMFNKMENDGKLQGEFKLVLKGKSAQNFGSIQGTNAIIDIDEMQQHGHLELSKAFVKVGKFEDSADATTQLKESMIQGETLDQHGRFDFEKVAIKESEHYEADAGAKSNFDSVSIDTKNFDYDGAINYRNQCVVHAENIKLGEHSKIVGEKTDESKLFKDKPADAPKEPEKKDDKPADAPKEPEKEFNPQHMFIMNGKQVELNGKISGGDYTQISGQPGTEEGNKTSACDKIKVGEKAEIDLKYGSIEAKNLETLGKLKLDKFSVKIDQHQVGKQGDFSFSNGSYEGKTLDNQGHISAQSSYFKLDDTNFAQGATEDLKDVTFDTKKMTDSSHLSVSGQVVFVADDYKHDGDIHNAAPSDPKNPNKFYVKAKTGVLNGRCDLDNLFFDIGQIDDAQSLICGSGKYSAYKASESFGLITNGALELNQGILRNCNIYAQADSITMRQAYQKSYDLTLVSQTGDVNLLADVRANNFYVQSAGKVITNTKLEASQVLSIVAKGAFENYGGIVNGKTVSIQASEIKNMTRGSDAAVHAPISVGQGGVINATEHLYLTATEGNIANYGGLIRAGVYAQLVAKGDVLNLCNTRTYRGQFDVVKEFDPGVIQGGSGEGEDKIGLFIKADGKVIGDASDFVSNGNNYIQGVKGIDLGCRTHTYVSNYKDEYGRMKYSHKVVVDTKTNFKGCDVRSTNGRNILISDEGGVTATGAHFISPGGTDIFAKKDVVLKSARYRDTHYEKKTTIWGANKSVVNDVLQQSAPTFFIDNGVSRIKSSEGCVDARGAYFCGNGDLAIEAHGPILLGRDVLDQQHDAYSRSVNFSGPGKAAMDALLKGQGAWGALTAEDTTLAKLNSLLGSQSAAELVANASNFGVDLTNTTAGLCDALAHNSLDASLLSRYGLGGAKGFNPSVSVGISETHTSAHTQTLGKGGIERGGHVSLKSDTGIEVFNGAPIKAGGNLDLDAPSLVAHSAELHTDVRQHSQGVNFNMNLVDGVQSVSVSDSRGHQSSTQQVYAEISAGGTTRIHHGDGAMDRLELDGAKITTKNIEGSVNHLIITDKQNERHASSHSGSLSSKGAFSVYASESSEKVTTNHSGIYTQDALNTQEHRFEVQHTTMTGGKIVSEGENHFQTGTLESHELHDSKTQIGVGYSGHLPDFKDNPSAKSNHVFDIAGHVRVDIGRYEATQSSVIFGAGGNDLHIQQASGDAVHTTSADGCKVETNVSEHLKVDVPVFHEENAKRLAHNLGRFFDKKPAPVPQKPEAMNRPPKRPSQPKAKPASSKSAGPHPKPNKADILKALKSLSLDPKKMHLDPKLASKAQKELANQGKLSKSTEKQLRHQIGEALLKSLKLSSEHVMDKWTSLALKDMVNSRIKIMSNLHMGTKIALIQFEFNLLLSDKESSPSDRMKHAAAKTSVDMIVGLVLKDVPGVGPILAVADIMDSFYDEQYVQRLLERHERMNSRALEAMSEKNYFQAFALADQAGATMAGPALWKIIHELANITTPIVDYVNKPMESKMPESSTSSPRL